MNALTHQRCFHHASREAAARCPQCRRFFCRECVTEHDGRVICAACLAALAAPRRRGSGLLRGAGAALLALTSLLIAWMFFHYLGEILRRLPDTFHAGG
ncbi:MAG: hypothetical protein LLG01_10400 [Planctomycetaceae bacterium]|nr:hypothetical protein [Planctomycetaceae bacterium]